MSESDIESQSCVHNESEESLNSDEGASSVSIIGNESEHSNNKNLVHKSSSELLQERINSLKESMTLLRNELKEERELWKKEVEEAIKLSNNASSVGESGDAGASQMEIEYPDFLKNSLLCDYENKIEQYKQSLAKNKANLQKRIAMSNYQRRLLEVENMCNLELLRVKQNIQFLQPLQMMTSEWNQPNEGLFEGNEEKALEAKATSSQIEMYTNQLYNDVNDMFSKITPVTPGLINANMASMPHLSGSFQKPGEEYIALSQSAIFFAPDCYTASKF